MDVCFIMTSIRSRLKEFLYRKDCAITQFVKYLFCGGMSVLVDQITFYTLAWLVFPCLRLSDPIAMVLMRLGATIQEVSEAQLKANYWMIKVVCFILSNAVVYLLNVLFVFHGGRHARHVEIAMFFGFALLQFVYIWFGGVLINRFGWEVTYANLSMLILGIITNYIVRKNIVFKG